MSLFDAPTANQRSTGQNGAASQSEAPQKLRRGETLEDKLKRRQAEIAARLHDIATKKKAENRERDARLDRIIGAACRADKAVHESVRAALKGVKTPAD